MAVITLGLNTFNAKATTSAKARVLFRGKASVNGTTVVSGSVRRIQPLKASVTSTATESTRDLVLRKYVQSRVSTSSEAEADAWKYKTISAKLSCESSLSGYWTERNIRQDMGDYMPIYYRDIREAAAIIQTEANEITRIRAQISVAFDNFFVNSSTYMLDRWESMLGLTPGSRDLVSRRQRINARLQGAGTSTLGAIKAVVESFHTCKVSEKNRENTIDILITNYRGMPRNFPDIVAAVNEIIPAHLSVRYAFSYVPWEEVEASFMEFYDVENVKWETLQPSYPQPPTTRLSWTELETMTAAETDIIQFSVEDTRLEFD